MERELGISESKKKSEQVYDSIMTLINRKIDKIRQKAFLGGGSADHSSSAAAKDTDSYESAAEAKGSSSRLPLSAKDSDLLKQLTNVRSALLREKALSDDLCDNIETTDREIKEMHFQDTQ